MGYVGVKCTGLAPQKAKGTPRVKGMEVQNFGTKAARKAETRARAAALTSLTQTKVATPISVVVFCSMRMLSHIGVGAVLVRWSSVAVYLRSKWAPHAGAAPRGRHVQKFM